MKDPTPSPLSTTLRVFVGGGISASILALLSNPVETNSITQSLASGAYSYLVVLALILAPPVAKIIFSATRKKNPEDPKTTFYFLIGLGGGAPFSIFLIGLSVTSLDLLTLFAAFVVSLALWIPIGALHVLCYIALKHIERIHLAFFLVTPLPLVIYMAKAV